MICPLCGSNDTVRVDPEREDGYCKNCKKFFKRGEYDRTGYLHENQSK